MTIAGAIMLSDICVLDQSKGHDNSQDHTRAQAFVEPMSFWGSPRAAGF